MWGKYNLFQIFVILVGTTIGIFAFLASIFEICRFFGYEPFKNFGLNGIIWVAVISLYLGLLFAGIRCYFIYREEFKNSEITSGNKSKFKRYNSIKDAMILLNYLENIAKKGDHSAVIRFGLALSRPLWLQGEYTIRIEIGRIVENAAAKLGNKRAQAAVLIDDIGWTYVPLKQYRKAKQNIEHGRQIASNLPNHYLLAKALRHLGGIAIVERGDIDEAISLCENALKETTKIIDREEREEMIAGINYGLSKIYWMKNELEKALEYSVMAKRSYEKRGDIDRVATIYSQLGKIYEKWGKIDYAKDTYREGLEFAERTNLKVEIIRNLLGIARILIKEDQKEEANEYLDKAKQLYKTVPITFEVGNMDMDIELLES